MRSKRAFDWRLAHPAEVKQRKTIQSKVVPGVLLACVQQAGICTWMAILGIGLRFLIWHRTRSHMLGLHAHTAALQKGNQLTAQMLWASAI